MEIPFQIIFAVILSLVLISSFFYALSTLRNIESKNKVFRSFSILKDSLENLCWSFPFSQKKEKLLVNENVIAFFVYHTDITRLNDLHKISDKTLEGNFICLAYESERIKCERISCNVTLKTYYQSRKKEFLDFILKSLYGLREFEINFMVFRNITRINIYY